MILSGFGNWNNECFSPWFWECVTFPGFIYDVQCKPSKIPIKSIIVCMTMIPESNASSGSVWLTHFHNGFALFRSAFYPFSGLNETLATFGKLEICQFALSAHFCSNRSTASAGFPHFFKWWGGDQYVISIYHYLMLQFHRDYVLHHFW